MRQFAAKVIANTYLSVIFKSVIIFNTKWVIFVIVVVNVFHDCGPRLDTLWFVHIAEFLRSVFSGLPFSIGSDTKMLTSSFLNCVERYNKMNY